MSVQHDRFEGVAEFLGHREDQPDPRGAGCGLSGTRSSNRARLRWRSVGRDVSPYPKDRFKKAALDAASRCRSGGARFQPSVPVIGVEPIAHGVAKQLSIEANQYLEE